MVDLFLVLALPSSLSQPVKIDLSQQLALLSQLFAMQLANQLNSISVKVMSASASQSLNDYQVFATLFPLVQRSQCKRDLRRRF
jgi:hypothetical protein